MRTNCFYVCVHCVVSPNNKGMEKEKSLILTAGSNSRLKLAKSNINVLKTSLADIGSVVNSELMEPQRTYSDKI